jgi:hypothetical protein
MSKGIDKPIDALIADLNAVLWKGSARQFFGRVYRSESEGKVQPLYYVGTEVVDVLKDDRYDAQCFVDVQPTRKMYSDIVEAECRICFMVNLSAIYPSLGRSEAVETVIADIMRVLMASQFEIERAVSGLEAFADYKSQDVVLADMSTHHLFRFDLKINYINC